MKGKNSLRRMNSKIILLVFLKKRSTKYFFYGILFQKRKYLLALINLFWDFYSTLKSVQPSLKVEHVISWNFKHAPFFISKVNYIKILIFSYLIFFNFNFKFLKDL